MQIVSSPAREAPARAMTALTTAEARSDERVVAAWLSLTLLTEGSAWPRSEPEIAAALSWSPHKVRQAIASLRRTGAVRREYQVLVAGERPTAVYHLADVEWAQS